MISNIVYIIFILYGIFTSFTRLGGAAMTFALALEPNINHNQQKIYRTAHVVHAFNNVGFAFFGFSIFLFGLFHLFPSDIIITPFLYITLIILLVGLFANKTFNYSFNIKETITNILTKWYNTNPKQKTTKHTIHNQDVNLYNILLTCINDITISIVMSILITVLILFF